MAETESSQQNEETKQKPSVATEVREQRHEFLLQYYNLAKDDLDRFLKIGWQTMAVAAGVVAGLSLGYKGDLPVPFSVAFAYLVLGWGASNLIDSNYWAVRAIAFLANVEAVYFRRSDARYFNPYVGRHPQFRMLPILRNQLHMVVLFAGVATLFLVTNGGRVQSAQSFLEKLDAANGLKLAIWALPLCFLAFLIARSFGRAHKRAGDYLHFVTECPGPGLLVDDTVVRPIDFSSEPQSSVLQSGDSLQRDTVSALRSNIVTLRNWYLFYRALAIMVTSLSVVCAFRKDLFDRLIAWLLKCF